MIASANELLYFIELSETLNFSRAAERIGISQPSLSIAIKRIEKNIGTSLFIRNKNGVKLTQAGKRLLMHSKNMLQLWEDMKAECLASHYEVQGNITFGCHTSLALHTFEKFLPKLLSQYAKLEIKFKHDLSRKILEEIINLTIDVGLVVNPIKHPDLILHKLYQDDVTFFQAKTAADQMQAIDEGKAVLICDPELLQTQALLKKIYKQGVRFRQMITTSSLEVIAKLTAQNCGIGILPTSIAETQCPNALQALRRAPVYKDEIYLVFRGENRNIKAIRAIIEAIKAI